MSKIPKTNICNGTYIPSPLMQQRPMKEEKPNAEEMLAGPTDEKSYDLECEPQRTIKNIVTDMVADFLYYNRREDEDTPKGRIEELIHGGQLSIDQIVGWFRKELEKNV